MLNPWLSLPFQAARIGLETQTMVFDQLLRMTGINPSDRSAASASNAIGMSSGETAEALVAAGRRRATKHSKVAQKVSKIHRKQKGKPIARSDRIEKLKKSRSKSGRLRAL
jgi:hypothetical protein